MDCLYDVPGVNIDGVSIMMYQELLLCDLCVGW